MTDPRLRVLIVDDDALLRASLLHVLTHAGYTARCAENGFAALSEIGHEIPDILLSDLNMPGLSGFELLSVVRQHFPSIRVIAMSGAYFGVEIPPGVFADAFYEKASGIGSLMQKVASIASRDPHVNTSDHRHSADA